MHVEKKLRNSNKNLLSFLLETPILVLIFESFCWKCPCPKKLGKWPITNGIAKFLKKDLNTKFTNMCEFVQHNFFAIKSSLRPFLAPLIQQQQQLQALQAQQMLEMLKQQGLFDFD